MGDHILVIEDSAPIRRLVEICLRDIGPSIVTAADGPSGLQAVMSNPPALIVLDIGLPGMHGWDVLAEIRNNPDGYLIPVVILTAGNTEYQTQKVVATCMPHDGFIVVSHECEKLGVVRRLLTQYGAPVLLIEDRPSVLDSMIENGLTKNEVITVRLFRQESPYFNEQLKHEHYSCDTLEDVRSLIES